MFECKDCIYDGSVFEFCDQCRKLRSIKEPNYKYDQLYKDSTSEIEIYSAVVELPWNGMLPPSLNELGYDLSKFHEKSDIPVDDLFKYLIMKLVENDLKRKKLK